jgi:hypothetical protein
MIRATGGDDPANPLVGRSDRKNMEIKTADRG